MCLPSDALSQHRLSYLGFSYLGRGVSLHGCSSKVQLLLLTLDEGYLLTATPPDLEHGVAPLGPPVPAQPLVHGCGVAPLGASWVNKSGISRLMKTQMCEFQELFIIGFTIPSQDTTYQSEVIFIISSLPSNTGDSPSLSNF